MLKTDEDEIVWTFTDTLSVAHWNLGHLSYGRSSNTTISGSDSDSVALSFKELLDSLSINLFGICEYEPSFSTEGGDTRELIFGKFPYFYIGDKYHYTCNAVFAEIPLYHSQMLYFELGFQNRYYIESTLKINDVDVLFVETHLDWNQGEVGATYRATQIKHLIDAYSDKPYVIICADFNVSDVEEYDQFRAAGFKLANDGSLFTYPADGPASPLDNIIFRGFELDSIGMAVPPHLSDHTLLFCKLLFQHTLDF